MNETNISEKERIIDINMIAFICATPLQIFNAVNIMLHDFPNSKMDIYALTFRTDLKKIFDCMDKSEIINNIYYINELLRNNNKFQVIKDYIQVKKVIKNIIPKQKEYYTDVFTTWVGGYGTAVYSSIVKSNHVKLHFYEEGIGVYKHRIFEYYGGIKKLYKVLGDKCEADNLEDIYLYAPDIIYKENRYKTKKIAAIDKEKKDDIKQINSVFNLNHKINYDQNIVYLENYLEPSIYGVYEQTKILNNLDKNKIIVRKHPITKSDVYEKENLKIDSNQEIPWELLLMNLENSQEKVFITILSTAVFSPKLIFDEEPTIVILAKAIAEELRGKSVYAENFWTKEFEELVYKLKEKYSEPQKVVIPESLTQFYKQMKEIDNKKR